jgi:WD40 repeat protein
MAMVTNTNLTRAWTVSADHQLVTYDLTSNTDSIKVWSTGHIGHASLALSPSEKVIAVGGWDGHIRLFSSATGKPLGDLDYHRESVHVVTFAHLSITGELEGEVESTIELGEEEDSDSEGLVEGARSRERWLVSGSKDRRVGLWELIDFNSASRA